MTDQQQAQDQWQYFPPPPMELETFELETTEDGDWNAMYEALLESICGATDDSQPVEQYDGSLGVTTAFVNTHQAAVGQIQWNSNLASIYTNPGNVSGVRWCTGTMISDDLFLTAGHCFDQSGGGWQRPMTNGTFNVISPQEIATNMHVNFNYQVDPSGNLRTEQEFAVTQLVEYRLGGVDFAILRLAGMPGQTLGTINLSTASPSVGDTICIIGHPAGQPKRIEAGPISGLTSTQVRYNDIDTLGGNSGSAILHAPTGRVVGVHTNGGCTSASPGGSGFNFGPPLTLIITNSPTLQALTRPTLKFRDDTLKVVDDGGGFPTLKFRDDTLKFFDDGNTLKFRDDNITLKFSDDGNTLKFADDGSGTLKAIDDVKMPGLDKQVTDTKLPGTDNLGGLRPPRTVFPQMGGGERRPFILQTPHHSLAWAQGQGVTSGEANAAAYEVQIQEYEMVLTQLNAVLEQGYNELAALQEQFQSVAAQYQALVSEYQQLGGRSQSM